MIDFLKKTVDRYAFFIVAFFFALFEIVKVSKKAWIGDFWTHAAVVHELTNNLFHPSNPIIQSPTPHAFFSPYSVAVAFTAKVFGVNPIAILTVFGYVNLFLFLICFYFFCKSLFGKSHQPVAALGLLFILFLWGPQPPHWSGFYHFIGLHYVLPYPSTFAMAASLLTLSLLIKAQERRPAVFALVVLLLAITFVTHPNTAIFLFLTVAVVYAVYFDFSLPKAALRSAALIIPALLLCLLWPYFNVLHLLFGNSADFNNDSKELYTDAVTRLCPMLLLLPSWLWLRKDKVWQFLATSIALMLLVYGGTYAIKFYGFSRLLSNALMLTQLLLAYVCFCAVKNKRRLSLLHASIIGLCFTASLAVNFTDIKKMANILLPEPGHDYNRYSFLATAVPRNGVVLSDNFSNLFIPVYGPKAIATKYPLYWINDLDERRAAVQEFFNEDSSDSVRWGVVKKFSVSYILIDEQSEAVNKNVVSILSKMGSLVYEKDGLKLIKCQ